MSGITDAELTAMYGRGLHPDTAARVIEALREARAEAERQRRRANANGRLALAARAASDALRLDVSCAAAERDEWQRDFNEQFDRAELAEARLAAVVLGACRDLTAAEARLAAVRELVDLAEAEEPMYADEWTDYVHINDIRAALEAAP